MERRLMFHQILIDLLGSTNVYFQPPPTKEIKYPCIIYNRSTISSAKANDRLYKHKWGYILTVVDKDPDSKIPDKILTLPYSRFDRHYTANNLNHDVFNVFY